MDVQKQKAKLLKNIAFLPGSRDRAGSPVIIFPSPSEPTDQPYEDIVSLIGYLSQIPDEKSKKIGFTIVVDGRKGSTRAVRNVLRACQHALYRQIRLVLVVKPEQFFDQQRINIDLMLEAYEFKTVVIALHKLSKYININQLPESLGGTYSYNHASWIDLRERYEAFLLKASQVLRSMKRRSLGIEPGAVIENGPAKQQFDEISKTGALLLDDLSSPSDAGSLNTSSEDFQVAAQRVETLLKQIKDFQEAPAIEANMAESHAKYETDLKTYEQFIAGVHDLIDWILGAGEKWLLTLHEIGESKDEAKQLCKEHEQLDSKSQEVLLQAKELNDLGKKMTANGHHQSISIERNRDQLHNIVRAFITRVKRQKEIVQQSIQFHHLLAEFSKKTDSLLESLCTEVKANSAASTEKALNALTTHAEEIDKTMDNVRQTGSHFLEQLKITEQNSVGKEVTRDYTAGVVHVRQQLEDVEERRRRCNELLDVRRLKLQQMLQLFTCEQDGEQAVQWIEELHETLLSDYNDLGTTAEDRKQLREDQLKLEETARSTYEYGKQLCQVSLVLRRSLRMEVGPQMAMSQKLEAAWGRLCRSLSQYEAKTNITDAFHSTIREVSDRLEDLCIKVGGNRNDSPISPLSPLSSSLSEYNSDRRKLGGDVRELKHMANILIDQLENNEDARTNRSAGSGGSPNGVAKSPSQDIREQLAKVEEKQRKLEGLWLNGPVSSSKSTNRDDGVTLHLSDVKIRLEQEK
uniref:CRAL-TRIO domain-containing protein n=1 Tax=Plectus sambesii TaxID=2011161 RepID=A0A914VCQ5_9BILA